MNRVAALRPPEVPAEVHGAVQMSVQRATLTGRPGAAKAALERSNVATAQLSARSEEREALHVAAVSHAMARLDVRQLEVSAPWVVLHEAASDERVRFSVAVFFALSRLRFRWMAQPARTAPTRIVRATASSSTTRQ
jgi:hypothetical protein